MNPLGIALCALFILSGCSDKRAVHVYRVPKELRVRPVERPLSWIVPSGWQPGVPTEMRMASFLTSGSGDVSVVMLRGEAGGVEANVNRWRNQLGLSELKPASVRASLKKETSAIGMFHWTKIENQRQVHDAILAAIIPLNGSTLFVKLMAPIKTVRTEQKNFVSFVKSIRVNPDER